ncbi:MAG: 2-oxoacid:acceptor oxidoreductase family protein [Eggerthella lenta]
MRNVLLAGVGGQGTVLAAKVLAQAAQEKGWQVRTAETIGMAQRGGNVVSHVRMGDAGEEVFAPLLAEGTADLVIAFSRPRPPALPFLAPTGCWSRPLQPSSRSRRRCPTSPIAPTTCWRTSSDRWRASARFVAVDDVALTDAVGSRKAELRAAGQRLKQAASRLTSDLRRALEGA